MKIKKIKKIFEGELNRLQKEADKEGLLDYFNQITLLQGKPFIEEIWTGGFGLTQSKYTEMEQNVYHN